MTIGSITPTESLLATIGTAQTTLGSGQVGESDGGLFSALFNSELKAVVSALDASDGEGGAARSSLGVTTDATVASVAQAATLAAQASAGTTSTTPSTASAGTGAQAPGGAAAVSAAVSSSPGTTAARAYVVTYEAGATPVSSGPTPAPFVKGPQGSLVLTAKTTGLTQLTPRFTGTVAHPTSVAQATPQTMAAIAALQAEGQA